ncbi:OmpH family outer membrane protein [Luteolibacter sp. Populi]|uniref:OmpH family outer membrane protein n=1 Tax=Luteolibacter sp. Populi TaxID=3230487 RepID=UPI003465D932
MPRHRTPILLRSLALGAVAVCLPACNRSKTVAAAMPVPRAESPPPTSSQPPALPSAESLPRLKIATVDMMQVFKEYHRTITAAKDQQADIVQVQQESDARLEAIRNLQTSLETLTKTMSDPAISDSRRQTAAGERATKQQDAIALERERRDFLERRQRALQEKGGERMKALFEEIRILVVEKAREEALDYVVDKSAATSSQIPFFLYTPDSADMTGEIIAHLNRDSPAAAGESNARAAPDPMPETEDR